MLPKITKETSRSLLDLLDPKKNPQKLKELITDFLKDSYDNQRQLAEAIKEYMERNFPTRERAIFLMGCIFVYEALRRQDGADQLKEKYQ